jgi:hypothetical protein
VREACISYQAVDLGCDRSPLRGSSSDQGQLVPPMRERVSGTVSVTFLASFLKTAPFLSHIDLRRENMVAKIWLEPVALERAGGFSRVELSIILKLVEEHRERLMRSWYEFFGR